MDSEPPMGESGRMLQFDAEASRRLEATYTTADVVEQRHRVLGLLAPGPGERIIDVGVGPGFLSAEIAEAVGPTGLVCGIDISESMLAIAETRRAPNMLLGQGSATQIPYPDGHFDALVSTQVLEYVADVPAALGEAYRVLRPGGRLLVLDTDWDCLAWRSNDPGRMNRVLAAWAQHLADPHLPRRLAGELRRAGFQRVATEVIPLLNVGFTAATYSAGLVEIIAAFVAGRSGVSDEDAAAWYADVCGQGQEAFFSLNRYAFCATRPGP
jgi:ubiquinone/menaquinone biosynthesis C-methylase UbiE